MVLTNALTYTYDIQNEENSIESKCDAQLFVLMKSLAKRA
jgi:hypothetical protein